jgi:predicted dehydrogenase
VIGAGDRLLVGVIGAGGNATNHMKRLVDTRQSENLEVIAVCDVYQRRLDAAAQLTGARPFQDYRRLLDLREIDYVLISVPEHWHAQMILDAADAGKHMYCEKPMTYSIEEGVRVQRRMEQTGLKLQIGVQSTSDDVCAAAQRYVRQGALGKVVLAQIDRSGNNVADFWKRPQDPDVHPGENLDWDAFLGPAKKRPFDADRFFSWRRYWDYCGGTATDLFVHEITRIIKICDLTTPSRVVATGGKWYFRDSAAEIPDTFNMIADYPEGVTVVATSTAANSARGRHVIRGHEATLEFTEKGFTIRPERAVASGREEVVYERKDPTDTRRLHGQNLHRAIRLGEKLNCDPDLGFKGMLVARMGVESFRRRDGLTWDARQQKAVKA